MISWYFANGEKGEHIADFVNEYKDYMYPTSEPLVIDGKKILNNTSSKDADDEIVKLLTNGIRRKDDIKKIIEWKTGNKFIDDSDTLNTYNHGKSDLSTFINAVTENLEELTKKGKMPEDAAKVAFIRLHKIKKDTRAKGIGSVYLLTILYFLSNGEWPIYDRFAHIACLAIKNGIEPLKRVKYIPLDGYLEWAWDDYLEYCGLLREIFGKSNISREQDRALWAYGHCFNIK